MNLYAGLVRTGASLMPNIIADPPSPSCFHLFSQAVNWPISMTWSCSLSLCRAVESTIREGDFGTTMRLLELFGEKLRPRIGDPSVVTGLCPRDGRGRH